MLQVEIECDLVCNIQWNTSNRNYWGIYHPIHTINIGTKLSLQFTSIKSTLRGSTQNEQKAIDRDHYASLQFQ